MIPDNGDKTKKEEASMVCEEYPVHFSCQGIIKITSTGINLSN
jgi:hypothetical protein